MSRDPAICHRQKAKRLINSCQGDFRALVHAALQTGARYGELARLQVADFNQEAGTLHVRKSKTNNDRHIVLTPEGIAFFRQLTVGRPGSDLLLGREWKKGKSIRSDEGLVQACQARPADRLPRIATHGRHCRQWLAFRYSSSLRRSAIQAPAWSRRHGHLAQSYVKDQIIAGAPRFGEVSESNVKAL